MATATHEQSVVDRVNKALYIAGEWREASGGETFAVEDPSTGEAVCEVADGTPEDGTAALDAAVEAREEWAAHPPRERGEILRRAFDEVTERTVTPFYRNQIVADRARIAEMEALREGRQPPPPDPGQVLLLTAAMHDREVFRAFIEIVTCLALPQEVLARPGVADRIARYADAPPPAPDRAQLLELLAG